MPIYSFPQAGGIHHTPTHSFLRGPGGRKTPIPPHACIFHEAPLWLGASGRPRLGRPPSGVCVPGHASLGVRGRPPLERHVLGDRKAFALGIHPLGGAGPPVDHMSKCFDACTESCESLTHHLFVCLPVYAVLVRIGIAPAGTFMQP